MSETLSAEVKQQIVIAAATVAGASATPAAVAAQVTRIAGYLHPNSEVQRAFAQIDKDAENTVKSSGFNATVIGYAKEEASKRGVVMFRSGVSTHTPEAKEHLRTDHLDGDGPVSAMMKDVQSHLVGHKARVSFDLVKKSDGSGHTVRVLRSLVDLGVDPEYDFNKPEYQPVYFTDSDKARSVTKLAFRPMAPALVGA